MVSTISATQAWGFAQGIELTVKAAAFYANQTPPADHGLGAIWAGLPVDPAMKARYEPLVRRAAAMRLDGAYPDPKSRGYGIITEEMTQESWSSFRSNGEMLTTIVENVGAYLAGDAPRPTAWRGPGPDGRK